MEQLWSWALTIALLAVLYLTGNNRREGWLIGIASQLLWVVYSIQTKQWGFLPGCIFVGGMYARNYFKWSKA